MTTVAAFSCIASILQLTCTEHDRMDPNLVVSATCAATPTAIRPTSQQQSVPHKPYIDMLPWPLLRDRMLASLVSINEDEFCRDMISNKIRIWGSTPWDPTGWEVSEDFAQKWWFLIDESIIRVSNFWRSQRGEASLRLNHHQIPAGI